MLLVFNKNNKDIFDMLRDGKKSVETRAATSKYTKIKEGDSITFSCDGERFEKVIAKVYRFDSIDSLFAVYKPTDINPKLHTREDIQEMYHSFPGYREKIEKEGIIAIEFR